MKFSYNSVILLLTCWTSVRAVEVVSPDPTTNSVQTTTPYIYEGEKGCRYNPAKSDPSERDPCGMYACRNSYKVMREVHVPLENGSFERLMYCCNQHEDVDPEKGECVVNNFKLKAYKQLCEVEGMTYYPELSSCIKATRYNPLDGCEGEKYWIEYNQELNQYICNFKMPVDTMIYNTSNPPAVLLPGKTIPKYFDLPLCKSNDDCYRMEQIPTEDGKLAMRCTPYPGNGSEQCEYSQYVPPPECRSPCKVTYTNEEDGYPSYIEEDGFTKSDIDTSYVYSFQLPLNRIAGYEWCVCKTFDNTAKVEPVTTKTVTKTVITYVDYASSTKPVKTIPGTTTQSVKTVPISITTTKTLNVLPVKTIPSAKCLPSTVTVTVKESETVTVKETVTVTV